ncbi:MAG: rhomboid family intramembrane serine protease [Actinomycetota bacterium]
MSTADRLLCPQCNVELARHMHANGVTWVCPRCRGRTVGMGLLRRSVARDYANRLWSEAVEAGRLGGRACPSCSREMIQAATRSIDLDVCKGCQLVWFDPGEYEAAPLLPVAPRQRLPEQALEAVARAQARQIADDYRRRYREEIPLEEAMLMVPGVLGLPLEDEPPPMESVPWGTWIAAVLIGVASLYAFFVPEAIDRLGLIPRDAARLGGLTFVTAFFLHGGVFQLIANLYFLAVFGDNVEDVLGHATFVMLIVLGALGGEIAHVLFTDARADPFVGATAGVSALVVFFGLKFPQAKLRYLWVFGWYTTPASVAVLLWFAANLAGRTQFLIGAGQSSPYVYLGGGLVGAVLWLVLRNEPMPVRNGSSLRRPRGAARR